MTTKFCSCFKVGSNYKSLKDSKLKILQLSDTNEFIPQGNFLNIENYDLLHSFLSLPLVAVYINEIFKPNKSIKPFHYPKIKGIFKEIKPLLDELFKRNKLSYKIPVSRSFNVCASLVVTNKSTASGYCSLIFLAPWISISRITS